MIGLICAEMPLRNDSLSQSLKVQLSVCMKIITISMVCIANI